MKREPDRILQNPEPPINVGERGKNVYVAIPIVIGAMIMSATAAGLYFNAKQEIRYDRETTKRDIEGLKSLILAGTKDRWTRADMRELEYERRDAPLPLGAVDEVWRKMRAEQ